MADEVPVHGHVKLSRKAYDSDPLWLERREFSRWEAWEDMIQFAAWGPRKLMIQDCVVTLERGEFLGSLRFLASRWSWTIKRVRTFVIFLIADERIRAQREAQQGSVYLLVNYEKYQGRGTPKGTAEAQQGHTKGTPGAQQGHKEEAVKQLSSEASKEKQHLPGVALVVQEWKTPTIARSYEEVQDRIKTVFAEVAESGKRALQADETRAMQAEIVFAYWAAKLRHEAAMLDAKRIKRLTDRLRENGGNVHELLFVVDGAKRSPHLMGQNDRNEKFDGIETLFRDRAQIEKLSALGGYKPGSEHPLAQKYAAIVRVA